MYPTVCSSFALRGMFFLLYSPICTFPFSSGERQSYDCGNWSQKDGGRTCHFPTMRANHLQPLTELYSGFLTHLVGLLKTNSLCN